MNVGDGVYQASECWRWDDVKPSSVPPCNLMPGMDRLEQAMKIDIRRKKNVKNMYLFPSRMVMSLCMNVG